MKLAIVFVQLFVVTSAFASGPDCITKVTIAKNVICDENATVIQSNCVKLCYEADTTWGTQGYCSFTGTIDWLNDGRYLSAIKILKEARKNNGGKLAYCLDKNYSQGTGIPMEFSIAEFAEAINTEDELIKEALARQKELANKPEITIEDATALDGDQ